MDRMGWVGELLLLDVLFLGGHGMEWCFWRMVGSFLLVVLYSILLFEQLGVWTPPLVFTVPCFHDLVIC